MSRRLLVGLQQVLLCAPAGLSGPLQTYPVAQALASVQLPASLPVWGSRSCRPFAASAQTQAGASSRSVSKDAGPHFIESPQQQNTIPADQYSYSGRLTEHYNVQRKPVFAVVELGPTQFKVTPDDLVYSEKLHVDVGDQVKLNRVLLLGNTATTVIGRPHVPGATVTAVVEVTCTLALHSDYLEHPNSVQGTGYESTIVGLQEQFLNGKVLIFKKRRRKNSRRLNGHRQVKC